MALIGKRPVKDLRKSPFRHSPQCHSSGSKFSKNLTNLHLLFSSLRNAFPHMVFSQSLEQHSYKVSPSLKILKREQFGRPLWLHVQSTESPGIQTAVENGQGRKVEGDGVTFHAYPCPARGAESAHSCWFPGTTPLITPNLP